MRNLWLLLIRNAFTLAFIALMAVSLSVLFRNDGAARSSWFRQTGAISYAIDSQRNGWSNYLKLAEQNAKLAEENADLRSRLLSMDLVASWNEDTVRHWTVRRGMLIKGPDGKPRSPSIATPGRDGGIETGMGVLSGGAAFGTVEEIGTSHCRILTLLHSGTSWSCRIGRNGPVASLGWDGVDMGLWKELCAWPWDRRGRLGTSFDRPSQAARAAIAYSHISDTDWGGCATGQ